MPGIDSPQPSTWTINITTADTNGPDRAYLEQLERELNSIREDFPETYNPYNAQAAPAHTADIRWNFPQIPEGSRVYEYVPSNRRSGDSHADRYRIVRGEREVALRWLREVVHQCAETIRALEADESY